MTVDPTAPGDATPAPPPPSPADPLAELFARVLAAPAADVDAAVTAADVAHLAAMDDVAAEGAVKRLAALKVSRRLLRSRIREVQAERTIASRPTVDGWRAALRRNRDGDVYPSFDNICSILEHQWADRLTFDRMACRPCLEGRVMGDVDLSRVRRATSSEWGAPFGKEDTSDAIRLIAEQRSFHPVADYLNGLTWDGVPRLDRAARTHLGLTTWLDGRMIRNTLVAAVARAMVHEHAPDLGTMVKTIPVIIGEQNAKKSTFWNVLGGTWSGSPRVDLSSNKFYMTIATLWFVELAEVDDLMTRRNQEETKAWSALSYDDYVPMYGRTPIRVVRSWVPVGTTNKDKILNDPTGSVRFWLLDTRPNGTAWTVNERVLEGERDQLFAEACQQFALFLDQKKAGVRGDDNPYRWWFTKSEDAERAQASEAYRVENPEAETVARWLAGEPIPCWACRGARDACTLCTGRGKIQRGTLPVDRTGREYVTAGMVLGQCLGVPAERHTGQGARVANVLSEIGWVSGFRFRPTPGANPITPYYLVSKHVPADPDDDGGGCNAAQDAPDATATAEDKDRSALAAEATRNADDAASCG